MSGSGATCELLITSAAAILHRRMPIRQEFSHTSAHLTDMVRTSLEMLYISSPADAMNSTLTRNPTMTSHPLRMFIRCALFVFTLTACVAAVGQELPAAKPESVGLSSERLERIATT